ncbi:LysR family transcriptional regulator [Candidatus Pacearchaeota archaeon]|nr:LysR family transcriptional regulator [Candidatus Pacearchaeota archaeon]
MDSSLKIFYTAAQLKSFTKAAQVLNLTQPAVTFQIKNLEDELKTRLFDRDANKITLTHTGKILLNHAEKILLEYEKAKEEISKISGKLCGDIRIGIASVLGKYFLPKLIGYFKQEYRDIEIIMLVGNSGKLIQDLRQHTVDLIIVSEPVSVQHFVVRPFVEDELVVIVNPQHKWAKRGAIELKELLKENIIIREDGSGTREVLKNFLSSKNISFKSLKAIMTMGGSEALKSAVESGIGYGIVSNMAIRSEIKLGLLKQIKIRGEILKRSFLVVYSKKQYNKHLISSFLDVIYTKI